MYNILSFPKASEDSDWDYLGLAKARSLSTEDLMMLWDSYTGSSTADPEIDGETVHKVLNERGAGGYCAV